LHIAECFRVKLSGEHKCFPLCFEFANTTRLAIVDLAAIGNLELASIERFTFTRDVRRGRRKVAPAGLAYISVLTRYFLPDHLNNTNVVTKASGTVIKVLDYYLCGSTRINQMTASQRQTIHRPVGPRNKLVELGRLARRHLFSADRIKTSPVYAVGIKLTLRGVNQECDHYRIVVRFYCVNKPMRL
jgi:hypothetical protein